MVLPIKPKEYLTLLNIQTMSFRKLERENTNDSGGKRHRHKAETGTVQISGEPVRSS